MVKFKHMYFILYMQRFDVLLSALWLVSSVQLLKTLWAGNIESMQKARALEDKACRPAAWTSSKVLLRNCLQNGNLGLASALCGFADTVGPGSIGEFQCFSPCLPHRNQPTGVPTLDPAQDLTRHAPLARCPLDPRGFVRA